MNISPNEKNPNSVDDFEVVDSDNTEKKAKAASADNPTGVIFGGRGYLVSKWFKCENRYYFDEFLYANGNISEKHTDSFRVHSWFGSCFYKTEKMVVDGVTMYVNRESLRKCRERLAKTNDQAIRSLLKLPDMSIKTLNREFVSGKVSAATEHIATQGPSTKDRIIKILWRVTLWIVSTTISKNDLKRTMKPGTRFKIGKEVLADSETEKVLDFIAKVHSASPLMGLTDIEFFAKSLQNPQLRYLHCDQVQPSVSIQIESKDKAASEQNIIAYPFVYPASGRFSYDHIVLVVIDRKHKTILYYDPQGLTSDDPSRNFGRTTMHEDLQQLARRLFPEGGATIIENVTKHQSNPVDCGSYVMRALAGLNGITKPDYSTEEIIKALSRPPKGFFDSDTDVRRQLDSLAGITKIEP